MEPDVTLGLVEVNINPGGSMLVVFRGFCQNVGHFMNKVPLTVMKSLGGYDPAKVIRKKDHGNRLLNPSLGAFHNLLSYI